MFNFIIIQSCVFLLQQHEKLTAEQLSKITNIPKNVVYQVLEGMCLIGIPLVAKSGGGYYIPRGIDFREVLEGKQEQFHGSETKHIGFHYERGEGK
jgi:predicted transcriptional regulator